MPSFMDLLDLLPRLPGPHLHHQDPGPPHLRKNPSLEKYLIRPKAFERPNVESSLSVETKRRNVPVEKLPASLLLKILASRGDNMPDAQRVNQRFTHNAFKASPETTNLMVASNRLPSNGSILVENVLHGLLGCQLIIIHGITPVIGAVYLSPLTCRSVTQPFLTWYR